MSDHEAKTMLADTPCPRCACHLVREFRCNCGEMHGDYCENCGRFRAAGTTEFTDLGITDEICTHGPVMHEHTPAEKMARIDRWHEFLNARRPPRPINDMNEARRLVKMIAEEYRRTKTASA